MKELLKPCRFVCNTTLKISDPKSTIVKPFSDIDSVAIDGLEYTVYTVVAERLQNIRDPALKGLKF